MKEINIKENKILAVIPARGGSKRLHQKNTRLFLNKPLIYYTLRFALLNDVIDKIIVTTDDELTRDISEGFDVEVIQRPSHLAGDLATTASAIQNTLQELAQKGEKYDYVVTLQITNPLRPETILVDALNKLKEYPTASSIVSFSRNRSKLGQIEDNYFKPVNYTPGQRSQDLSPVFSENGLLYVSDAKMVLEKGDLFGSNILSLTIDEEFPLVDIDTIVDLQWGEYIFEKHDSLFKYLK